MTFAYNKVKFFKEGVDGFVCPFLYPYFIPTFFIRIRSDIIVHCQMHISNVYPFLFLFLI